MSSLLKRIAERKLAEHMGRAPVVQPVADSVDAPAHTYAGSIQPSMPSITAEHIKSILDTKDKSSQQSRTGKAGYTHVSTITSGVCVRHYLINGLFDRKEWEAVTGGHQLMWKYGRTAEAHIRGQFTKGDTYGLQIFGDWKCKCELTCHTGTKPKQDRVCPTCRTPLSEYHEHPWFDDEHKIVGNPDIGVFIGRFFLPFEIKSMSKNLWDKLTEPMAEHVNQALLYRHLAKINGLLVHDKVIIIYAVKEFKWGSPYKVFEIDVTEPRWVRALNFSLEIAAGIRDGFAAKRLPKRLDVCTDIDARRAKGCAACATCFNMPNE